MRRYCFIGLGGFLGAVLRYVVRDASIWSYKGSIPFNTLFVNVTGSFALAFFMVAWVEFLHWDQDLRSGISVGFLGGYTTFSTLCRESAGLLAEGKTGAAVSYIAASTVLGLAAAYLGFVAAQRAAAWYGVMGRNTAGKKKEQPGYVD